MTSVLKRIEHLVGLAGSPAAEEARNAAYKACELIRKHGVVLELPKDRTDVDDVDDVPPEPDRSPHPCRSCAARVPWDEAYCDVCKRAGRAARNRGRWVVDCEACGVDGPDADTQLHSIDLAWKAGFRIVDGKSLCLSCTTKAKHKRI